MNGVGKRASVDEHAMLEHHERHVGVPRGMGNGREFLGAPETLRRDVHAGAAIQNRFQPGVQTRFRHRN